MRKYIFKLLAIVLLFVSCQEAGNNNVTMPEDSGALRFSIAYEGEQSQEELSLIITISQTKDNGETEIIESWSDYKTMPEVIYLKAGEYSMTISSEEVMPKVSSTPYYYSNTMFVVKDQLATYLEMSCSVLNMQISVELSSDMQTKYPNWFAEVILLDDADRVLGTFDATTSTKFFIEPSPFAVRLKDKDSDLNKIIIVEEYKGATNSIVKFEEKL